MEEVERLERSTDPLEAAQVLNRCSQRVSQMLRGVKAFSASQPQQKESVIDQMDAVMTRAWTVPSYGQELGNNLCNVIRDSGGLDVLINSVNTGSKEMDLKSARVLGQCLTTENRQYVVEKGLDNVVKTASDLLRLTVSDSKDNEESRVGSNLLKNLFKHSEDTCSDVVRMGGLDAVIAQCKNKDVETLRHCASALANLALYGGPENQQAMMQREVPTWLFPLAFHNDDNIKYYACLAIASMVANKQIEAAVLKSGTLDLVDPFVTSHDPSEFSKSTVSHLKGQSKNWLRRLVPVLFSNREEARKLAAFHFCMEAGVKKQQGCPEIFEEIGAIEPLKQVASSPNALASKYAAQALRTLGLDVPHKLSQQVPLWSVRDVKEWVKQVSDARGTGTERYGMGLGTGGGRGMRRYETGRERIGTGRGRDGTERNGTERDWDGQRGVGEIVPYLDVALLMVWLSTGLLRQSWPGYRSLLSDFKDKRSCWKKGLRCCGVYFCACM